MNPTTPPTNPFNKKMTRKEFDVLLSMCKDGKKCDGKYKYCSDCPRCPRPTNPFTPLREKMKELFKKAPRTYYCEDCDDYITSIGNHNADHTVVRTDLTEQALALISESEKTYLADEPDKHGFTKKFWRDEAIRLNKLLADTKSGFTDSVAQTDCPQKEIGERALGTKGLQRTSPSATRKISEKKGAGA